MFGTSFVEDWMGIAPIKNTPFGYLEQRKELDDREKIMKEAMPAIAESQIVGDEFALKDKYTHMIQGDHNQMQINAPGPNGGRRKIPTFKFSSRR